MQQFQFEDLQIQNIEKLGFGYMSEVFLGFNKKTQEKYAVKIINLQRPNPKELTFIQREIDYHMKLIHPNIVRLLKYFIRNNKLFLVMEYVEGGTLWEKINSNKLKNNDIFQIFKQIISALSYIHSQKIIHRDIKPENILISKNNEVKVCDFGFCAPYGNEKRVSQCGTQEYMCPEIFNRNQQDDKLDIWCLGILLYELVHNKTPFKGKNVREQQRIQKQELYQIDPNIPKLFKKIIKKCLNYDSKLRPTSYQILQTLQEQESNFLQNSNDDYDFLKNKFNFQKNQTPYNIQINNFNIQIFQPQQNQHFQQNFQMPSKFTQNSVKQLYPIIKDNNLRNSITKIQKKKRVYSLQKIQSDTPQIYNSFIEQKQQLNLNEKFKSEQKQKPNQNIYENSNHIKKNYNQIQVQNIQTIPIQKQDQTYINKSTLRKNYSYQQQPRYNLSLKEFKEKFDSQKKLKRENSTQNSLIMNKFPTSQNQLLIQENQNTQFIKNSMNNTSLQNIDKFQRTSNKNQSIEINKQARSVRYISLDKYYERQYEQKQNNNFYFQQKQPQIKIQTNQYIPNQILRQNNSQEKFMNQNNKIQISQKIQQMQPQIIKDVYAKKFNDSQIKKEFII